MTESLIILGFSGTALAASGVAVLAYVTACVRRVVIRCLQTKADVAPQSPGLDRQTLDYLMAPPCLLQRAFGMAEGRDDGTGVWQESSHP